MKTFQKLALVSAIAAAPFAAQAMEALDDSVLGNTTGQAGVTVEINIASGGISIGEVIYTDTATTSGDPAVSVNDIDTNDSGTADTKSGGQVSIQNINISNVNGLEQTIDVSEDGDLLIGMSELTGLKLALGGNTLNDDGTLKKNHSAVALRDSSGNNETELVNNLDVTLDVGASTTFIRNLNGRTPAELTSLDIPAAAQGGSVVIQATNKVRITDLNAGIFGYTAAQATVQGANLNTAVTTTAVGGTAAEVAAAAKTSAGGILKAQELLTKYNATPGVTAVDAVVVAGGLTAAQQTAVDSMIANGAAVNVSGVTFNDGAGGYATVSQNIWAKGGSSELGGGVYIQIAEIAGTLTVGSIEIGGASIGSVQVKDINLAGLTQRIYGH